MAKDITDTLRDALGQAVRGSDRQHGQRAEKPKSGGLPGGKGLLAGAGLAAAAPLAKKGLDALQDGSLDDLIARLREHVESGDDDQADAADDEAPDQEPTADGAGDEPDDDGEDAGEERGGGGGPQATGKGRRMPIQQAIDVAVPLEAAYNQFAQFEDWPEFMHRVTRVEPGGGRGPRSTSPRRSGARPRSSRPRSRRSVPTSGSSGRSRRASPHAGVVTFHRARAAADADRGHARRRPGFATREGRARHAPHQARRPRRPRGRFKAFIEMQEAETGAWRGVIEDGEVVEPHDDSYDEERDYSEVDDLHEIGEGSGDDEAEPAEDEDGAEEQPKARPQRGHGSRSRSRSENGRGKPVGSGGGHSR